MSNRGWVSKTDADARIAKLKDGRTHLAYKAEHVVDLESGGIMSVSLHHADEVDTKTVGLSLEAALAGLGVLLGENAPCASVPVEVLRTRATIVGRC